MDVSLTTNRPGSSLEFRDIKRFDDGSGFETLLVIESTPFAATVPFWFERHSLEVFLGELHSLNESLSGTATLKPMWEPQVLRFEGDGRGHVNVSGDISSADQQLRFTFQTDQSCLGPLIKQAEGWFHLAAV